MSEQPKRGRGRPPKYVLKPIDATPDQLLRAVFRHADKRRKRDTKQPPDNPAAV